MKQDLSPDLETFLDEESVELVERLERLTGTPALAILAKLLGAHVDELWQLCGWLEDLPPDDERYARGRHLIDSYGPTSLLDDIKAVDPSFVPLEKLRPAVELRR